MVLTPVEFRRRKLADLSVHPIASIYGLGYRFEWRENEDAT
jgi:hypothetical protein